MRVKKINATSMTVAEGAHMLSISLRQMKRIKKRCRKQGPRGLLHQRRGKLGNRRYESSLKNHVLTLLQCQYEGFGPTLAAEMLKEIDGIPISRETLRQWMSKIISDMRSDGSVKNRIRVAVAAPVLVS